MTRPACGGGTTGAEGAATAPDAADAVVEIAEFTDPMCPWSWGAEPRLRRLLRVLGEGARHRRVFGVLFDEDDDPAPDPAAETAWYARYVAEIATHTGAPRAERLRWVAASSWPSSLAAAAAEAQGPLVGERVLRRLRESAFVLGEPADTPERVLAALAGVPGLDEARLRTALADPAVRERVRRDRAEARRPRPEVVGLHGPGPHPGAAKETGDGHRYALPTLVFSGPAGCRVVPGWRTVEEYLAAVAAVAPGLWPGAVPEPTAAELLERYRSLAEAELVGAAGPLPGGARRVATGHGVLVLHPDERSGPAWESARRAGGAG
ncbi:DsbA family protein [Streptomyces sp. BE20]|uniref:DsbA family protein n=1 Tax=Streptomyces sp. BE20 TaxID=3002525 RepID=UPI002E764300|nr:DsbA family protein [Streptomyces sp. BE20]MEE1821054.1 DsbA family protein [Streptomyces sp. BE20]